MNQSLSRRFLVIGAIVGGIFFSIHWLTGLMAQPRATENNFVTVTTITPQHMSVTKTIHFSGPVVGRTEVPVYAELSEGRISNVLVEEGQHVKAGQVLATVDTSLLAIRKSALQARQQKANAAVAQQAAMLEAAEVQLKEAQSQKLRGDNVAKSGFLSNEVAEQRTYAEQTAIAQEKSAHSALDIAKADQAAAAAELAESQLYYNKTSVRASVAGTIIEKKAIIGQVLGQTQEPLFVMLHNDVVEVELDVSTNEINNLQAGVPASIQIIGDNKLYAGVVRLAAAKINRNNQMGKLRVRFIDTPKVIPGQFARVTVSLKAKEGLYIPDKAIRLENGLASVFTAKDGVAVQLPVVLGDRSGDMVEILEGLTVDTPIIDGFAAFIRAGERVRVAASVTKQGTPEQK
ncbi:MAG TPA: HlyD family efflux transporter periplasmic adaptor subunit [Methylophilaceae bacterium]|jgi:multidrug efflux pump subunit AcrA (membrane-fusion protein)